MLTEQLDRNDYPWLQAGCSLHHIIDGIHQGKLVEVLAVKKTVDTNNDGSVDMHYLEIQSRRVDVDGNTILVNDTPIVTPKKTPGISHDAIANGMDPMVWTAERMEDAITRVLNLETNITAFAFMVNA